MNTIGESQICNVLHSNIVKIDTWFAGGVLLLRGIAQCLSEKFCIQFRVSEDVVVMKGTESYPILMR